TRPSDYEEIPFEEDELEEVKTVLLREEEADRAALNEPEEAPSDIYEEPVKEEDVQVSVERPDFDDQISPEELLSIRSIPEETEKPVLSSEEGVKRVVTASGKVIESDTELLRKKVEQKREEAREEDRLSPAVQIA